MVETHLSEMNCEQKPRGACCVRSCPGRENHKQIGSDGAGYPACWKNCKDTSLARKEGVKRRVRWVRSEMRTHTVLAKYVIICLFTALRVRGQDVAVFGG